MRILRIHNRYQQRGGEDACFEAEAALLADRDHHVDILEFSNAHISDHRSILDGVRLAATTVWSHHARDRIRIAIEAFQPDIIHFDNTFPLVSPAAYAVGRTSRVAVVQTLHNYRLLCPSATLFREGHVCEDCLGKTPPLPSAIHGCYRDSRAQTAVVAAMLTTHRVRRTWTRDVDRYIALTEFSKRMFVKAGLPDGRIAVKPNSAPDHPLNDAGRGDSFLFVGRLAVEKGISTLVDAARRLPPTVSVRIAGDGPLRQLVQGAATTLAGIAPLGRLASDDVRREMERARALIFPSTWYEGFPITLVEAFSRGLPVIASRLGAMEEIIDDGRTGLLFEPGNAEDLAAKVQWAWEHPEEMRRMGEAARREYEVKYTADRNYHMLMDIYHQAIDSARQRRRVHGTTSNGRIVARKTLQ